MSAKECLEIKKKSQAVKCNLNFILKNVEKIIIMLICRRAIFEV